MDISIINWQNLNFNVSNDTSHSLWMSSDVICRLSCCRGFFFLLKLTTVRRFDLNNIFLGCPSHLSNMSTVNTHRFKRTLNQNTPAVLTRENIPSSTNLSPQTKRNVMNFFLKVLLFQYYYFAWRGRTSAPLLWLRSLGSLQRWAVQCPVTLSAVIVFKPLIQDKTRCHLKMNETLNFYPLNPQPIHHH